MRRARNVLTAPIDRLRELLLRGFARACAADPTLLESPDADWLNGFPGAPRHAAQIHRMLRGRFYLGEMRAGGDWIRGEHPPLVDLALWERVQEAMRARRAEGRRPRGERTAGCLLRGLARCGLCGRSVAVAVGRYGLTYYVCAKRRHRGREGDCAGPYVRSSEIDGVVEREVLHRLCDLSAELRAEPPAPPAATRDLAAARARASARLSRAVQLAVDGAITASELAAHRRRLESELADIARSEADATIAARAADPSARLDMAGALLHLEATWAALTQDERREAITLLAARIELNVEGNLRWTWRTPDVLIGHGVVPALTSTRTWLQKDN